jgi:hypothetical protein
LEQAVTPWALGSDSGQHVEKHLQVTPSTLN